MAHINPEIPNRNLQAIIPDTGERIIWGQKWACEDTEGSDVWRVLYHSQCPKCRIKLEMHMNDGPMVLIAHGKTYKVRKEQSNQGREE